MSDSNQNIGTPCKSKPKLSQRKDMYAKGIEKIAKVKILGTLKRDAT